MAANAFPSLRDSLPSRRLPPGKSEKFAALFVASFCLLTVAAYSLEAGESSGAFSALPTELKVSGPAVSLRCPLGRNYRPGYAIPIEVRVHNLGAAFQGELIVTQDTADEGLRAGLMEPLDFPPQSIRVFSFPIMAPPVSADLVVLIREVDSSGRRGPLRFQASLSRIMKPLAPEKKLVLTCGAGIPQWGQSSQQETVYLPARELPEALWAYENLDLVILGDRSLADATPAARTALRHWLLFGGRVFLASNEALTAAIAADLLPLKRASGEKIGADRGWWERHAGLVKEDILAEINNRPVYVKRELGFGQIVFRFPGTSTEDATTAGARVFSDAALVFAREKRPDLRVQPDRYAGFAFNAIDHERRSGLSLWAGLGALVLCIGLVLGFSSRSRWVAAGWPLVTVALLAVLLTRWFPARDLMQSQISYTRLSTDRRAIVQQEWTLLESFQEPIPVTVRAEDDALLVPIHAESSEIRNAQLDLLADGSRLRLQDVPVLSGQPALFYAAGIRSPEHVREISYPIPGGKEIVFGALEKSPRDIAVWVRADGRLVVLKGLGTPNCSSVPFDDWKSVLRLSRLAADEAVIKGYAASMGWASRDALRSGGERLIFWTNQGHSQSMTEIDSAPAKSVTQFQIWSVPAALKE